MTNQTWRCAAMLAAALGAAPAIAQQPQPRAAAEVAVLQQQAQALTERLGQIELDMLVAEVDRGAAGVQRASLRRGEPSVLAVRDSRPGRLPLR